MNSAFCCVYSVIIFPVYHTIIVRKHKKTIFFNEATMRVSGVTDTMNGLFCLTLHDRRKCVSLSLYPLFC